MKIGIIISLSIFIAILGFMLVESGEKPVYDQFPVPKNEQSVHEIPFFLYLYFFFSNEDAPGALQIIQHLNGLPTHFKVVGVVPDQEMESESQLRRKTGATFPIKKMSLYQRYKPFHTPTLYGVSERGRIYFIQPVSTTEIACLKRFLYTFYQDIYPALLNEKK
jgi:hypothetical protein